MYILSIENKRILKKNIYLYNFPLPAFEFITKVIKQTYSFIFFRVVPQSISTKFRCCRKQNSHKIIDAIVPCQNSCSVLRQDRTVPFLAHVGK